ncbi:MAG: nitroreductase family protein [Coriobacteriia bacterium]|nr:nitroreductase family protein [Coriobacteriia bacterium]
MLTNEVVETIMVKRRSYKVFTPKPVSDEILETILECGKIAPTGMNRQPWHFTVIKTPEAMESFGLDLLEAAAAATPAPPTTQTDSAERTRFAPIMIIVSADSNEMCAHIDAPLAMQNMLLAAASFGLGTGWDFFVNRDFFEGSNGATNKTKYGIPEGYTAYCACYFGYHDDSQPYRDRGPRREGTVTIF